MPDGITENSADGTTTGRIPTRKLVRSLDPGRVASGEVAEIDKVKMFGVYEYDMREVATNDELDESVKVKWLRTNMGTPTDADVRCRLVTKELVFSQRMDELIVGTLSFIVVKLISHHRAKGEETTRARYHGFRREVCLFCSDGSPDRSVSSCLDRVTRVDHDLFCSVMMSSTHYASDSQIVFLIAKYVAQYKRCMVYMSTCHKELWNVTKNGRVSAPVAFCTGD